MASAQKLSTTMKVTKWWQMRTFTLQIIRTTSNSPHLKRGYYLRHRSSNTITSTGRQKRTTRTRWAVVRGPWMTSPKEALKQSRFRTNCYTSSTKSCKTIPFSTRRTAVGCGRRAPKQWLLHRTRTPSDTSTSLTMWVVTNASREFCKPHWMMAVRSRVLRQATANRSWAASMLVSKVTLS